MKLFIITIFLLFPVLWGIGQEDFSLHFIGNNFFNNKELLRTKIQITDGVHIIKELNTNESNHFKIELSFGKTYDIYFTNSKAQKMYIRILADIPTNKRNIDMTYELKIPFFPKDDNDQKLLFNSVVNVNKLNSVYDS